MLCEPLDGERRAAVIAGLKATLADVYAAVDDFPAMLGLMATTTASWRNPSRARPSGMKPGLAALVLEDAASCSSAHGLYDYPRTPTGRYAHQEPLFEIGKSLGVIASR